MSPTIGLKSDTTPMLWYTAGQLMVHDKAIFSLYIVNKDLISVYYLTTFKKVKKF